MAAVKTDKEAKYREIAQQVVREYAALGAARAQIKSEVIVDPATDHYQVLAIGWQGARRVHSVVIHLEIIESKIWIQHDSTDWCVADALLEAGVPRADIVLAFQPEYVRADTGFAVA